MVNFAVAKSVCLELIIDLINQIQNHHVFLHGLQSSTTGLDIILVIYTVF